MKIQTSTLTGPALNFAVATAQGLSVSFADWYKPDEGCQLQVSRSTSGIDSIYWILGGRYDPAGNWAQGGPLLEQEGIQLHVNEGKTEWLASCWGYPAQQYGPTPLIAACRCFVAFKLGDEVDIPDDLQQATH